MAIVIEYCPDILREFRHCIRKGPTLEIEASSSPAIAYWNLAAKVFDVFTRNIIACKN